MSSSILSYIILICCFILSCSINITLSNEKTNYNVFLNRIVTPINIVCILLFAVLCRMFDQKHRELLLIGVSTYIIAYIILT